MANTQQLENPPIPELPVAGVVYSGQLVNQTSGILRTFFIRLMSNMRALFGTRGGQYLNTPYGAFQDSTNQTASSTTTAYAIALNTTDFTNGVSVTSTSHINVSQSGLYNVQFSIQFKNTTNDHQDIDLWFARNGTNISNSNSRFSIPSRKSTGDPSHLITTMNFFVSLDATDYIQLMWRVSDVGVSIEQYAASSSPTRPAIPSAIVTVSFVSNIYS